MMPDVEMSPHGYIAIFLGIFTTAAVGIGLMALMFYSNRRGYDEAADCAGRGVQTHDHRDNNESPSVPLDRDSPAR